MKITLFTSNHARHLSLVRDLAAISEELHVVSEVTTVFPGERADFFAKSDVMQEYFTHVRAAETTVFGPISFNPEGVSCLAIKTGDLSAMPRESLEPALDADAYVVFGASYIKGWLVQHLVDQRAINIHMGVSPYFRGSSCNFWALADQRPELVGSTVHYLSAGLDSGPMLYHAVPNLEDENPFEFTMKAVKAAHKSLVERLATGEIFDMDPVDQDGAREVRYSRNADFDDEVARTFLATGLDNSDLRAALDAAPEPDLLRPFRY